MNLENRFIMDDELKVQLIKGRIIDDNAMLHRLERDEEYARRRRGWWKKADVEELRDGVDSEYLEGFEWIAMVWKAFKGFEDAREKKKGAEAEED